MAKKKFIAKAIKRPGSLTKLAKASGMSINSYCNRTDLSKRAKQKCAFYKNVLKKS